MNAKQFDKKFDDNNVDIIDDLDLSTIKRLNQPPKKLHPTKKSDSAQKIRDNEVGLFPIPSSSPL